MSEEVVADESQQFIHFVGRQALPFGSAFVPQKCLWPLWSLIFTLLPAEHFPMALKANTFNSFSLFHFLNLAWLFFFLI